MSRSIPIITFNSYYPIKFSGKLSREKTFTKFVVLEPPAKVFSHKSFPLYSNMCSLICIKAAIATNILAMAYKGTYPGVGRP